MDVCIIMYADALGTRGRKRWEETYILTDIDAHMRTYAQCMHTWMHAHTRRHAYMFVFEGWSPRSLLRTCQLRAPTLTQTNSPQDVHHPSSRLLTQMNSPHDVHQRGSLLLPAVPVWY